MGETEGHRLILGSNLTGIDIMYIHSYLISGEEERAVEVWCLHYNQVCRHGVVRWLHASYGFIGKQSE